jgi:hypothetical protein
MRLEVGRVDHDRLLLGTFRGQSLHHPGEDPHVAPSLPSVVKGLGRAILPWRIAPTQPVAIDKDYAAKHTSVIDPRLAMALRKKRLQPLHLLVGQPEKVAHPRQFGSLNHPGRAASTQSMDPDPSPQSDASHKTLRPVRRIYVLFIQLCYLAWHKPMIFYKRCEAHFPLGTFSHTRRCVGMSRYVANHQGGKDVAENRYF